MERVGRWWDGIYGSKTAGRILGWLMICEPPHQSSQEMVETLETSAGSVSTQTRLLISLGLVETVTFLGDRSNYYQLRPNVWEQMMWSEQERMDGMRSLTVDVDDVMPSDRPERVTELARTTEFMLAEWPTLMDRLSKHLRKETSK